jgi:hypothetical protein
MNPTAQRGANGVRGTPEPILQTESPVLPAAASQECSDQTSVFSATTAGLEQFFTLNNSIRSAEKSLCALTILLFELSAQDIRSQRE